ncbi:hypothetical protein GKC30_14570 [Pseudodesulfovibrio sp. F-1]|uniref:Uncharacterized protein n=1 Tax=Pseudodesulfovibrio alkaliphilus TaxID=2661613 RepID=A0A7K1KRX6_9BACT|nr:hypothetical protein [Pseudodesulfovibrio alkaliphilus]MUM78856.1 hypothetical protein [Pseudodesulfovibrio alkaliphilus]
MTRRNIFRGAFKATQRVADAALTDGSARPERIPPSPAELEAIAGDFPPELLSLEAQRLGLDPESPDREALLVAIYEAMSGRGPGASGP